MGFLIVTVSHFCFYLKGITGFEVFAARLPNPPFAVFYVRDNLKDHARPSPKALSTLFRCSAHRWAGPQCLGAAG